MDVIDGSPLYGIDYLSRKQAPSKKTSSWLTNATIFHCIFSRLWMTEETPKAEYLLQGVQKLLYLVITPLTFNRLTDLKTLWHGQCSYLLVWFGVSYLCLCGQVPWEIWGMFRSKFWVKTKISRNFNVYLSQSSIYTNQLTCRMLCVHRSRWIKDVKEKIITAIDDIDDQER